jgi:hypothetical protein
MSEPDQKPIAAPKRRWFRFAFSLRTLFVVVTVLAAAMGYLVWKARTLRQQSQIILDLQGMGATISFDHEIGRPKPVPTPGPEILKRFLGEYSFAEIVQIQVEGEWVTDDTLARIAKLPGTISLILTSDNITDRGLAHIAQMPDVSALELESRRVTAAGYAQLKPGRPMVLIFRSRDHDLNVDDSWMPQLANLTRVRYLYLENAPITDAGLAELHRAKGLRRVWLTGTHATAEGVKDLQNALPDCEIFWP